MEIREITSTSEAFAWIIWLWYLKLWTFWVSYLLSKLPKAIKEDEEHNVMLIGGRSFVVKGKLPQPKLEKISLID